MSIRLGITGGIGSGKSVVAHLLQLMGVPVYISDVETRHLMNRDEEIKEKLMRLVGRNVYEGDVLNRKLLADFLFADEEHALQVNRIVHPAVKKHYREWVKRHACFPVVAMESAILIESGFADEVDRIVMVYASRELRLARAMERDSAAAESVKRRMDAQMSDEEKLRKAHHIIYNDGRLSVINQVVALVNQLV